MIVLSFLVSVIVSMIDPMTAVAGIGAGVLWSKNRRMIALGVIGAAGVGLLILQSTHHPVSVAIYFAVAETVAVAIWAAIAAGTLLLFSRKAA